MKKEQQSYRQDKPLSVSFSFLEGKKSSSAGRRFRGFVEDISVTGVRIKIVDTYGFFYGKNLQEEIIKLSISIPQLDHILVTTGIISWIKSDDKSLNQMISLGVKFNDLSATDCQYLENYLSSNLGDQKLLWDLWDKEVKP
ncbi:MAG: PilZ domain-containing protein [Pseudomonadota bacterium]|nr:PilZ domain-containing protein [Pseudomonadota bacterium]